MKKTKIIATIGPASKEKETLEEMIKSGMDIARINLTHASHDFCKDIITKIKEINHKLNTNVSVMLDLEGPDVTVGKFVGGSAYLNQGDKIRIYMEPIVGDNTKFSVSYKELIDDVKCNTIIKINDGLIVLNVLEKGIDYLLCEVITGGFVEDNKTINVLGVRLNIPFITEKDKLDLKFANELNIDYLALSFVSSSEDVLTINDILIDYGNNHTSIIAKIETENAVEDIDQIIKVSDGIMIERGDLGVELPLERLPGIQKSIINKCHLLGKISIVATEMLSSMENIVRPTRAEVTDVANAVLEGVDVVMLSGETTVGKYPTQTIEMMYKIIESSEEDINYYELMDKAYRTEKQDTTGTIAYSVVECADRLKCVAIVTPTISGFTAKKISRFRPSCPIIALTPSEEVAKALSCYYGVYPVLVKEISSFDMMMTLSKKITKKLMENDGGKIIITGGYPFKEVKHTNFMKIEEL